MLLQQRFEQEARRSPHAVALRFGNDELTYGALDERAGALAAHLRSRGVGPEVLVGVCLERSLELVVGLYAVLKAGGAYVPLDPGHPRARLDAMLHDLGDGLVLTQARFASLLPDSARVIVLDRPLPDGRAEGALPKESGLAYVIYTSGSTGTPNGAMNTHAGIVNRIEWMQDAYRLQPNDVVLQKTPYAFDVSVWELFWPLAYGAKLIIARPDGHKDPAYLRDLIQRERVTTLHFVPSMLTAFLETPGLEAACSSITRVMASGEALPREAVERFYARMPGTLHNLYGPTEAAVDVTSYACRVADPHRSIPIGKAIANITMHVLDAELRVVPDGEQGELYIGGVGVGRGYHRRPDKTAARFVPSPFGPPGARLYRTGDLASVASDGNIEYVGRTDSQVKLRGFRIELGEIETTLRAQPGVREAAVLVRTMGPDMQLVAYVAGVTSERALRNALGNALPAYMVPSTFMMMDALPLSPNGKLDRNALPEPAFARAPLVEPRDDVERELVAAFEDALHIAPIGIHDDFFALGGHSLTALRLIARLTRPVSLAALLESPTVEQLAQHLRAPSDVRLPLVRLRAGTKRPLFLVHPIGGSVFCYLDLARRLGDEQAVYGIQQLGLDGDRAPQATIEEQATTYIAAMKTVQPEGPYLIGGWSFGGMVAHQMAYELEVAGDKVELLANLDTRAATLDMRAKMRSVLRDYDPAVFAFWFVVIMSRIAGVETARQLADFEGLEPAQRLEKIRVELARLPGGEGASTQQLGVAFELFVANFKALNAYDAPPVPRMDLFRAIVPVERLPNRPTPPPWGWEPYCAHIVTHDVESTHFMLVHHTRVDRLAPLLAEALARAHEAIARR